MTKEFESYLLETWEPVDGQQVNKHWFFSADMEEIVKQMRWTANFAGKKGTQIEYRIWKQVI